jgi:PAS domain S-box-containing protein
VYGVIRGALMRLAKQLKRPLVALARGFVRVLDEDPERSTAPADGAEDSNPGEAAPQQQALELLSGAVLQSSVEAIVTTSLDGTITAWNPAAERLFGFAAAEAIGSNIKIIIPAERREEHQAIFDWTLSDRPIENLETIRMTKDGRRMDVSIDLYTVKSNSGAIIGVAGTSRDISAQKFAEEKFRLAVESCPNGMVMSDRAGRIVMVNHEIERLFGYRREELIGRPIDILVPERLRAQHFQYRFEYSVQPRARRMGEGRNICGLRKDGGEIPIEIGLNPIPTREGLMILSVIVDTSERKQAEEMFRHAVEACPSGMVVVDRSGKLVMVNTEIENMFGYRRDELLEQPVEILVPHGARSQHAQYREDFAAETHPRRMDERRNLQGRRKDGTEFPIEVGLNPMRMAQGLMVLAVIVDITERKRLERLKDEFVSTVSHELRTPLTSIYSSLGLIMGNAAGVLPDAARRLISIAHSNSQRLVGLVNDILDIEKLESGQLIFNLQPVEVRPLVEQTIEANRAYADTYRVKIRLQAGSDVMVRADPGRLSQVLTNLISNAIKFSPLDGEVVVAIEPRTDVMRFSVRDCGPGIPPEFKSRIFERFAQADATNTKQQGGTGLGLSIVKQIVDRLGGQVGFDDAPGGGTVFHVDLPYCQQAARDATTGFESLHIGNDGDAHDAVVESDGRVANVVSARKLERAAQ